MKTRDRSMGHDPGEEGYILLAVLLMVAIMLISLAVALPKVKEDIQRDRELETMQRGKQYVRAIRLYYRKFGGYPSNVDVLVNTNEIRFLRQKYTDPITGLDDWAPIYLGQNKAPTAMGFFGQPLGPGGVPLASMGVTGSNGIAGATNIGSNPIDNSAAGSSTSGSESAGEIFGGGPIIGFSPASTKPSILIYKTKGHYDEWEFVYDPLSDRMPGSSIRQPSGASPPNTGAPGFGPTSGGLNGGNTPTTP